MLLKGSNDRLTRVEWICDFGAVVSEPLSWFFGPTPNSDSRRAAEEAKISMCQSTSLNCTILYSILHTILHTMLATLATILAIILDTILYTKYCYYYCYYYYTIPYHASGFHLMKGVVCRLELLQELAGHPSDPDGFPGVLLCSHLGCC